MCCLIKNSFTYYDVCKISFKSPVALVFHLHFFVKYLHEFNVQPNFEKSIWKENFILEDIWYVLNSFKQRKQMSMYYVCRKFLIRIFLLLI
jgi:hypothetical protein